MAGHRKNKGLAALLCLVLALTLGLGLDTAQNRSGYADEIEAVAEAEGETGSAAEPAIELPPPLVEAPLSVQDTYALDRAADGKWLFTNRVDGYQLTVPAGFTVDMDNAAVRAVLYNDAWKVEIYRQPIASGVSARTYIDYSNRFIHNTADHWWENGFSEDINGYRTHVMQWSRRDLAAIDHDFNHYACVNMVVSPQEVYTFFFKADNAFGGREQYIDIVSSFAPVYPTRTAFPVMTQGPAEHDAWDPQTQRVYDRLFGEEARLTWGLYEHLAPMNMRSVDFIEKNLKHRFAILLLYVHCGEPDTLTQLERAMVNTTADGRTLELTLQTIAQPAEEGNMVYDVLDGAHDEYLRQLAELIAANAQPVLFRLGNEMNGDWCPYSAYHTARDTDVYQAFNRYVYDKLDEYGAGPWLIKVWNPNERSFPNFKWNDASLYYPVDDDVDVIGLTGYNTGTYYAGEVWRSFDEIYAPLYQQALARHRQPLMITEFACSSIGGDKVQWVQDMFARLPDYPAIKAAVWWSGRDLDAQGNISRPYWIDDDRLMTFYLKRGLSGLEAGWMYEPEPEAEELPFRLFL